MDEKEAHHTRSIYSPLEFLGDVGGLIDAFSYIGSILVGIIQLITGSGLNKHLLKRIFTKDMSKKIRSLPWTNKFSLVTKRKAFGLDESYFCYRNKNKYKQNAILIGEERIAKELDIVHFVK